jgi:hypothetical protein
MINDLQTFNISLKNLDGPLPVLAVRASALNGLFYTEIGKKFPDWVDAMHQNSNKVHPFSLSLLADQGSIQGIRICALNLDTAGRVADVWGSLAARGSNIQLGSANMVVTQVYPGQPHATGNQQLWEETPLARGVRLYFETPMRLLAMGHSSVLPAPRIIWEWYVRRWLAFSGLELPPEFIRWVEWQVHTTELHLETHYTFMEETVEWKGIVGEVAYHAFLDRNDVPETRYPDYLRGLQALARLAEFSGTGEKVSMGMGRTRFVKAEGLLTQNESKNAQEVRKP